MLLVLRKSSRPVANLLLHSRQNLESPHFGVPATRDPFAHHAQLAVGRFFQSIFIEILMLDLCIVAARIFVVFCRSGDLWVSIMLHIRC